MAFTYVLTDNIGKVRFLIGDTVATDIFLQDDEITYLLTTFTTVHKAAIEACRAIAARLSREANKSIGDLSLSLSTRADSYFRLAKELQTNESSILVAYCGGISVADKQAVTSEPDRVTPVFKRDMMSDIKTPASEGE